MAGDLDLKIRLRTGQHDDLIEWYRSLPSVPYGAKAEAVRELMRAGLGRTGHRTDDPIDGVLAVLLPEIRTVVESALASALTQLQVSAVAPASPEDQDDETERLLDEIGAGMILEE